MWSGLRDMRFSLQGSDHSWTVSASNGMGAHWAGVSRMLWDDQARRARSEQRKGSASGNTDMAAGNENRLAQTRRARRARSIRRNTPAAGATGTALQHCRNWGRRSSFRQVLITSLTSLILRTRLRPGDFFCISRAVWLVFRPHCGKTRAFLHSTRQSAANSVRIGGRGCRSVANSVRIDGRVAEVPQIMSGSIFRAAEAS